MWRRSETLTCQREEQILFHQGKEGKCFESQWVRTTGRTLHFRQLRDMGQRRFHVPRSSGGGIPAGLLIAHRRPDGLSVGSAGAKRDDRIATVPRILNELLYGFSRLLLPPDFAGEPADPICDCLHNDPNRVQ